MVSLFGSARPVYRKCGFELAGSEIVYEAETAALPARTDVDFFPLQPGRRPDQAGLSGRRSTVKPACFDGPKCIGLSC